MCSTLLSEELELSNGQGSSKTCERRETELADQFPIHVVTAWLGDSPQVAQKHHLQTTEDHFARAVEGVPKCVPETARNYRNDLQREETDTPISRETARAREIEAQWMTPTGLEPVLPA